MTGYAYLTLLDFIYTVSVWIHVFHPCLRVLFLFLARVLRGNNTVTVTVYEEQL